MLKNFIRKSLANVLPKLKLVFNPRLEGGPKGKLSTKYHDKFKLLQNIFRGFILKVFSKLSPLKREHFQFNFFGAYKIKQEKKLSKLYIST